MTKPITFTLMHFIIAISVAYLLTGSWTMSGAIALVEPLVNSVGYVVHEKVWQRIQQGATMASAASSDSSLPA